MSTPTIRPVGVLNPTAEVLLIGSLLWASAEDVAGAVQWIEPDDLESAALQAILAAMKRLSESGSATNTTVVHDELRRCGGLSGHRGQLVNKALADATTSGASDLMVRPYAAAVVAEAYRRRYRSLAESLIEFADTLPEVELMPYLTDIGTKCRKHSERLAALRGER